VLSVEDVEEKPTQLMYARSLGTTSREGRTQRQRMKKEILREKSSSLRDKQSLKYPIKGKREF